MMIGLLLAILLPVLALLLIVRSETPNCKPEPTVVVYDSTEGREVPAPGRIPRIVWSYWHTDELPLVVERCLRNWTALNPGFAVNLVTSRKLFEFVDKEKLPKSFPTLGPTRQSDWLRLYLLHRYGGIWLDASIILTRSLDWLIEAQAKSRAHYVGFYLDRYTVRLDCPVIDSWSMAAPKDSRFVADWLAELSGPALADSQSYIESLGAPAQRAKVLQHIASPLYMTIHVAAQAVLEKQKGYRLHLIRAEDSAYFFQAWSGRWKRAGFFACLLLFRRGAAPPPLIKLRGGERRKLEPYLRRGLFSRASIVGTCLHTAR